MRTGEIVLELIAGTPLTAVTEVYAPRLVVRASTGPPRA